MKNVVPEHRIVPIPRDVCTKRIVLGFILKWNPLKILSKQLKLPFTFALRFAASHEEQYWKHAAILKSCEVIPSTRKEIESLKSLILFDCIILLGCDLQWMRSTHPGDGACAADSKVGDGGRAAEEGDGGRGSTNVGRGSTFGPRMESTDNFMLWSPNMFSKIDFTNDCKLSHGPLDTLHSYCAIAITMLYHKEIQDLHKDIIPS